MQDIRSSNPPVVTGICDPNNSRARHHRDDFCMLLKEIDMNFDIISLTESRIKKNSVFPINIEQENYSIEHTPTETATGGALLYIGKRLFYHPRNDLNIYTPGKLETTFADIVCPKSSNTKFGCIYKHPYL